MLCKKISENLNLDKKIEIIYFVLISIFATSLVELDSRSSDIPSKFFLVLFFLFIFFESIKKSNKLYIYNLVIGLLSSITIFCYLDIGIYLYTFLFFLIIYLIYRAEYKKVFLIGMMYSGKTTIGQILASQIKFSFLDDIEGV